MLFDEKTNSMIVFVNSNIENGSPVEFPPPPSPLALAAPGVIMFNKT